MSLPAPVLQRLFAVRLRDIHCDRHSTDHAAGSSWHAYVDAGRNDGRRVGWSLELMMWGHHLAVGWLVGGDLRDEDGELCDIYTHFDEGQSIHPVEAICLGFPPGTDHLGLAERQPFDVNLRCAAEVLRWVELQADRPR